MGIMPPECTKMLEVLKGYAKENRPQTHLPDALQKSLEALLGVSFLFTWVFRTLRQGYFYIPGGGRVPPAPACQDLSGGFPQTVLSLSCLSGIWRRGA